jgi:hypothetical protein
VGDMLTIFCLEWVLKPENSLVWHREVLAWINKYTGLDKSNGTSEDGLPVNNSRIS